VNSTTRRIARETWQRASDAISNAEKEGAEFDMWWGRLAGLLQRGIAGPRTWKQLQGITKNVADGADNAHLIGETAEASAEEVDPTAYEE
jgi:hypothetical protein